MSDDQRKSPVDSTDSHYKHVIVRRSDIERCSIEPTLTALEDLFGDDTTARRFQNRVTVSFQGYDDDPRGLFQIAEVCRFVKELDKKWWYAWFFFMTKDVHISPLAVIALCLCGYTRSPLGLFIPNLEDSKQFFSYHFSGLRGFCQVNNLSEEETESAVQEVVDYFMKVGFVEGCDSPQLALDSAKTGTITRYMHVQKDQGQINRPPSPQVRRLPFAETAITILTTSSRKKMTLRWEAAPNDYVVWVR